MPTSSRSHAQRGSALQHALDQIAGGARLSSAETEAAVGEIIAGAAPTDEVRALLLALREAGESPQEIAGAVRALRRAMRLVAHIDPDRLVDTCGTGGGTIRTINISTAAAFVVAGAGVPVAKHGNRSFTSRSGSADLLEAMGIPIDPGPDQAARILAEVGIVFLYAPTYHPAMRHVAPVRRGLGVPTLMNLVGPLSNPAGARRQVVGVADIARAPMMASALRGLGALHALVVHAELGMDEISPVGHSRIWSVQADQDGVAVTTLDPSRYGLATPSLDGLEGGSPEENAARILALFDGPEAAPPALRAAVLLNAAAGLVVADLGVDFGEAVQLATASLESGRAQETVRALQRASEPPL